MSTGTIHPLSERKCYDCIYRGELPGSAHSRCDHPAAEGVKRSQFMRLAGVVGKRGGIELTAIASAFHEGPEAAVRALNITAVPHGVKNGWFVWPVNFDPVWLKTCDGFTPMKPRTGTTSAND